MDPIIGAGLLSLGGSLFGSSKASSSHKQSLAQAQEQFNAQMDQSVQRRVADAKKAGIHPLFALGASVGASPTLSAGGADPGGGILAGGIGKLSAAIMEATGQKKLNEAQAAYYSALAAKTEQDGAARGRDGVQGSVNPVDTGPDVVYGAPEFVPPQVAFSKSPGVESGTHPSRRDFLDSSGNRYQGFAPGTNMDEVGQLEYLLGLPHRMFNTVRRDYRTQRDVLNMERDLKLLKRVREEGGSAAEYEALRSKIYAKARELRDKLARWYKNYRSIYE